MVKAATAPAIEKIKGVRHGFFERTGGVSEGIYGSLNCGRGSDDVPSAVTENRRRIAASFSIEEPNLLTLYQEHSPNVKVVNEIWDAAEAPRADAMVTTEPGIALGILTADCAPVLFADGEGRVVGAAHAGWRGAFGGVLENTVAEMVNQGADKGSITAALGPCISQASYEVGDDFRREFVSSDGSNKRFFEEGRRAGHWQFDLMAFVQAKLDAIGITVARDCADCTYDNEERFFSFRRTTHLGESDYGRQVSVIMRA